MNTQVLCHWVTALMRQHAGQAHNATAVPALDKLIQVGSCRFQRIAVSGV